MRFWDTSGIIPLLLEQEASADVRPLVTLDERLALAARLEGFQVLP